MSNFDHVTLGQRVVLRSHGAAQALAEEVERRSAGRLLVIAGRSEADLARSVCSGLPVAAWFEDVVQHVPVAAADRARAVAADNDVDLVVSIGGGSTTGFAKAVALTTGLPVVAVPTTYAGSEATNVWGLTDDRTKTTGTDDRVLPRTVIYDAALTITLPVALSVASGLNGLAHCVDSLWAPRADPINRALATEGATALAEALVGIVDDPTDLAARERALYGCYLAAVAFASAGSGLHHKICHVLGGRFDLPHAETHATVLPHVLALNAPHAPEAERRLARVFKAPTAVQGLDQLRKRVDAPRALRDYGFREEDIPSAAEAILPAVPSANPTPVDKNNLTALLHAAWEGTAL
ncbi:maleylacetate reductase [Streptomyces sp. NPDC001315]|uniref:maleylacetate reductase n=1 Tax=Streptomyces sp. NPDC001315 TaxID=3364562 RepID=UPI003674259B